MDELNQIVILTKVRTYPGKLLIHMLLDRFQPEFTPHLERGWNDICGTNNFPELVKTIPRYETKEEEKSYDDINYYFGTRY